MGSVTLNPTKNVHIAQTFPTTNQYNIGFIDVGESNLSVGDIRRTLIQFDLSSIPAGSTIITAQLKLYDQGTDLTNNARTMSIYRLKRSWVENQATWNVYSTGNSWSTAGAINTSDSENSSVGSISMPNPPVSGYVTITISTTPIQEWLDGTFANNGFLIYMATEADDMHRFDSRNETNKPQLIISYTQSITLNLTENLGLTDGITKSVVKFLTENLGLIDVVGVLTGRIIVVTLTETLGLISKCKLYIGEELVGIWTRKARAATVTWTRKVKAAIITWTRKSRP